MSWFALSVGTKVTLSLALFNLINCGLFACNRNRKASLRYQRPFLSIPMRTTSYLFLSIASIILFADCSETSCSADFPPKRIATRIFFFIALPLLWADHHDTVVSDYCTISQRTPYHGFGSIDFGLLGRLNCFAVGSSPVMSMLTTECPSSTLITKCIGILKDEDTPRC